MEGSCAETLMHHYPLHIGDYNRDTGHLSVVEHGVYRLLMDAYYVTERPLPADLNALCRLVRAMTKPERDAVGSVAKQFFAEVDGVLRHKRIDAEIAELQRAFIETQARLADMLGRMERLQGVQSFPTLRAA